MARHSIREARHDDLDWIASLEQRAFPVAWEAAAFLNELEASYGIALALEDDAGGGVAYLFGRRLFEEAHILKIAVDPAARRAGLGARLLEAFEAHVRHAGADYVVLEVRVGNEAARRLYAGHGYVEIACKPRYYPDGEDGLLLMKRFTASA